MFTSQDFNEFSVISSIYVWVFYCHNILSRIVLSSVILVFTTTMRKNSIFLFSNTLSQIAHFDFTFFFWEQNDDSIEVLGYLCLSYCMRKQHNVLFVGIK